MTEGKYLGRPIRVKMLRGLNEKVNGIFLELENGDLVELPVAEEPVFELPHDDIHTLTLKIMLGQDIWADILKRREKS